MREVSSEEEYFFLSNVVLFNLILCDPTGGLSSCLQFKLWAIIQSKIKQNTLRINVFISDPYNKKYVKINK